MGSSSEPLSGHLGGLGGWGLRRVFVWRFGKVDGVRVGLVNVCLVRVAITNVSGSF